MRSITPVYKYSQNLPLLHHSNFLDHLHFCFPKIDKSQEMHMYINIVGVLFGTQKQAALWKTGALGGKEIYYS